MTRWHQGSEGVTLLVAAVALAASACSHAPREAAPRSESAGAISAQPPLPAAPTLAAGGATRASADPLAAFERVRAVLQNPRCQNCHPPGEAPLEGDEGRAHDQNVARGPKGEGPPGLGCSTCHGLSNAPTSYGPNMPPGAPDWHMPPPDIKMVFVGMASGPLCHQLKDSKRNGGKDLGALLRHVSEDSLVLWGWSPGVGRAAVGVPHADFVASFRTWVAAGAPCPP